MISHVSEQSKRSMGSHRQGNAIEVWKDFTSNILLSWTILERRSQVQEEQADHPRTARDSNKDSHYSHYVDMQSVVHLRRSLCFAWSVQSKQRSLWSWKTRTFHRRPRELDTSWRCNWFGRRNAAKTAKPLFTCHKRKISQQKLAKTNFFVTRPSIKNEGRRTLACREYTLSHSDPNSELVCALKDNVRIGPTSNTETTNLSGPYSLKSWHHRDKISKIVLGYSSSDVEISTSLRCNSLLKKQSASPPCEEDSQSQEKSSASNEQSDQISQCLSDNRRGAIIEKATIPVKAALTQRGPPVSNSYGWKFVAPNSDLSEMRSHSQAVSEESTEYSSTRTSSSRTRSSRHLAQIDTKKVWCVFSTSGWKRYQMDQAGWELNIVLTHTKNRSTSKQYKATVTCHGLIPNSLGYLKFRMSGKYTSTIQYLPRTRGHSSKEDWSREAPVIAQEDKYASSQSWTYWRSHCPIS